MVLDLYQLYGLDREADEHDLGWKLSRIDSEMRIEKKAHNDPQRKACEVAYGILSDADNRRIYDESLSRGEDKSWDELEFLSDFGRFPRPEESILRNPQPQQAPQQNWQSAPRYTAEKQQQPMFFAPPTTSSGVSTTRNYSTTLGVNRQLPTAKERQHMKILDFVIYAVISGALIGGNDEAGLGFALSALLLFVYFVGCEAWFGGTPGKLINNMEVKNVDTGANLSIAEAARRNLWTLASIVPGIGYLVTLIWGMDLSKSIEKDPEHRGNHDREVGAIVVKKNKN